ncbi:biotin--[acetyl-CoA-carboxylase] ligase [Anaerospora hongkongensis]|uniref:biotin--[acetyl-CoA-carboxylase] ligase n=1 Tax=Anaerospora hongkongensis TaxID=244830 RepID=UPI00289F1F62|nr:biotin--[acetyl-CoA-carboxylase] ligase [Anaerospora hongkongensis]
MRTQILQLLRAHSGQYISGEDLSRMLAVSRTAIWKHIQSLKNEGYAIEAHPRLGYTLRQAPDLLSPKEIESCLHSHSLGRQIHYFSDVGSTNNEAKKIAADGCPEGTIVVAEAQTVGRGRLSRGWFSPYGKGIWLSVVLRPPFQPQQAPKCTLMAAVAVTKAIRGFCDVPCGIKWPNDILYEGKKLVGILTEMSAEMDAINYIVIGMGVNVNTSAEEFPPELAEIATSILAVKNEPVSRLQLLCRILAELELIYQQVIREGFAPVLEEWKTLSVTLGQAVNVIGPDEQYSGTAVTIDEDGALLVETDMGLRKVIAGDVSIRPQAAGNQQSANNS